MIKNEFIAKPGLEEFFDLVVARKEQFEIDLENAKAEAVAEVEKSFQQTKDFLDETFSKVSVLVQVEIPDEETEEEIEEETNTIIVQ